MRAKMPCPTILLTVLLVVMTVSAQAEVGQVLFALGDVTIEKPAKKPLKRRDKVDEGDVIVTGPRAYVQLKLADGTKIAIRPNSRFVIEALEAPATSEHPAIGRGIKLRARFNLKKGGFRTITGFIGKRDRSAYQVSTPSALIGIRGTNYVARLCSADCGGATDDGLYVGVSDGAISMTNDGGDLDLSTNQYGFVPDFNTPPERLISPPASLQDDGLALLEEPEEEEDEENGDDSEDASDESEEDADEEESVDSEEDSQDDETDDSGDDADEDETDDSDNDADEEESEGTSDDDSNDHSDDEADDANDSADDESNSSDDSSESSEAESGESSGDSSETDSSEPEESAPANSEASSDNSNDGSDASDDDSTAESDQSASDSELSANAPASDDSVAGSGDDSIVESSDAPTDNSGDVEPVSNDVIQTDTTTVTEETTSIVAERGDQLSDDIATTVTNTEPVATEVVVTPEVEPEQEIIIVAPGGDEIDITDGEVVIVTRDMSFATTAMASGTNTNADTISFDINNGLTDFDDLQDNQATRYSLGTAANKNIGFDPGSQLRWGRWAEGIATQTVAGVTTNLDLTNSSLHWIVAPQDDNAPAQLITGSAAYTLTGNTDPTDNLANVGILGSASFSADFTNQTVQSDLRLGINNQVWTANGSGTINTNLFSGLYSTVTVDGANTGGSGSFGGMFTGFAAEKPAGAGLNYRLINGATTVNGAVVFGNPTP